MPNYKESEITGSQWTRAFRVVIENPYNKQSAIVFMEEKLFNTGDQVIKLPLDSNLIEHFNPESRFKLIDPDTLEPIGIDMSHMDLYVVLNSLYMHLAYIRDNPPEEIIETVDTTDTNVTDDNIQIDNEVTDTTIIDITEEDTNVNSNP